MQNHCEVKVAQNERNDQRNHVKVLEYFKGLATVLGRNLASSLLEHLVVDQHQNCYRNCIITAHIFVFRWRSLVAAVGIAEAPLVLIVVDLRPKEDVCSVFDIVRVYSTLLLVVAIGAD